MSNISIGIDNPVFSGRVRVRPRASYYERRPIVLTPRVLHDVVPPAVSAPQKAFLKQTQASKSSIISEHTAPRQSTSQTFKLQSNTQYAVPSRRRIAISSKLLTGMAVFLFIVGMAVSFNGWYTNKQVVGQLQAASGITGDDVDETVPSDDEVRNYKVAPDFPRYLTISKIGVKARVKALDLTTTGEVQAPKNVHDVGWFSQSSKPGQGGAILLDGHKSGLVNGGVFQKLNKLVHGDILTITRGDDVTYNYRIVKTETLDTSDVDMNKMLLSIEAGKTGLNIITCEGKYDAKSKTYDKRHLVYAVQE